MTDEVKPLFQNIPPYNPRRRNSLSHPVVPNLTVPVPVPDTTSNFYNHQSQGSRHSVNQTQKYPTNTYQDDQHLPFADYPTQFFQLVPFYQDEAEGRTSMALVPVTKDTIRRSLDGGRPSQYALQNRPRQHRPSMESRRPAYREYNPAWDAPRPRKPSFFKRLKMRLKQIFGGDDVYDDDRVELYSDKGGIEYQHHSPTYARPARYRMYNSFPEEN